jgi:hypothetical protein
MSKIPPAGVPNYDSIQLRNLRPESGFEPSPDSKKRHRLQKMPASAGNM